MGLGLGFRGLRVWGFRVYRLGFRGYYGFSLGVVVRTRFRVYGVVLRDTGPYFIARPVLIGQTLTMKSDIRSTPVSFFVAVLIGQP